MNTTMTKTAECSRPLPVREPVTLITTERNERSAIEEFLDSVLAQSMLPDEIVIADGGSNDGTLEVIQGYIDRGAPIRLVVVPGNRSVGRNTAIRHATSSIIACTDVGSRLDADWLRNITEPFRSDPTAMAVSGFYRIDARTYFERITGTLMVPRRGDIDAKTFLPSSRSVAFRKEAWQAAGGYPEYTNFNEDTPFDLALQATGIEFRDGLDAEVAWRPRSNLRDFYRQYYFYAVGDGLDRIGNDRVVRLTRTYAYFLVSLAASALVGPVGPLAVGALFGVRQSRLVYRRWRRVGTIRALALMLIAQTTFDASQILGYWFGVRNEDRLRNSTKLVR